MLDIVYLSRFKRDLKTCQKRNYDLLLFKEVVDILRIPDSLPRKNRPHPLSGNYSGFYECHIAPDWLLIYKQTENQLLLARTGSHSDLFR